MASRQKRLHCMGNPTRKDSTFCNSSDCSSDEDEKPALKRIAQPTQVGSTEISIASYNVWFGQTGHEEARMQAIVEALTPHSPVLIGFQEVTVNLAQELCPLLESLGYHTVLQPFISYGCAVACKVENVIQSGYHPFAHSEMDRGIVWALVFVEGREVLFTTTHLESFISTSFTSGREREVQLLEVGEFCERCLQERPSVDLAIISGDLNWDDERLRSDGHNLKLMSLLSTSKWFDTFRKVELRAPGYTYDSEENPMLGGTRLRRRFDRILVCPRDVDKMQVKSVQIIGKEAIPGLTFKAKPVAPSDHFGFVAKVVF